MKAMDKKAVQKAVQRKEDPPEVAQRFRVMAVGRRVGQRWVIETGLTRRPAEQHPARAA